MMAWLAYCPQGMRSRADRCRLGPSGCPPQAPKGFEDDIFIVFGWTGMRDETASAVFSGWRHDEVDIVNDTWRQHEESAAERFLRGAIAADPTMVVQALRAAVRSSPSEADSLTALAIRLVPQAVEAIEAEGAKK